jgi:predicted RNase H-like nuclease (RuvC/YqgF family)
MDFLLDEADQHEQEKRNTAAKQKELEEVERYIEEMLEEINNKDEEIDELKG